MGRTASQYEAGKKKVNTGKPDVCFLGYVTKNDNWDSEIGTPDQEITTDVKPAMKFRPLSAMPTRWPVRCIKQQLEEIQDIFHKSGVALAIKI